jgi:hypothetical protein
MADDNSDLLSTPGSKSDNSLPRTFRQFWYSLWFVEVWVEKREVWKEFAFHAALYLGCLVLLELSYRVLNITSLPINRKDLIDAVYFYLYPLLMVLFGAGFIVKAYRIQFGHKEKKDEDKDTYRAGA